MNASIKAIELKFGTNVTKNPFSATFGSLDGLTVTGVQKVLHCSPESAAIETSKGTLHLTGVQLSVVSLNLETGEAKLTGRFDLLEYTQNAAAGGVLRRLLRG